MTATRTLADLTQAYDRMSATQQQLSSGKRINKPSDDPYGASRAIQLSSGLAALDGYQSSVDDGTAWTQATDSSLMSTTKLVQRVRDLVVQAQNGTNSPAQRSDIAAEVDQLTAAVKQEANSTYAGQYIFSGTKTTTAPYATGPGPSDAYLGDPGAVSRAIGPGTTLQVNSDISQVLNDQVNGPGLLSVLRDISKHMGGGDGTGTNVTALGGDLTNIDTNIDSLSAMQANVGATENRLSLASSRIQDLQSSMTKQLSNTQDADMAKTIINYTTEQSAYTAALRASSNIVQSSLMDFLK